MPDEFSTQVIRFTIVGMLGVIVYFLRGVLSLVRSLDNKVHALETKVEIILDRDKRKRFSDSFKDEAT